LKYKYNTNGYPEMRKWATSPIWDICTIESQDKTRVSQSLIDGVVSVLQNEVAEFYQQPITDINIYETDYASRNPQFPEGHITIYWNDGEVGGANYQWFNGTEITAGMAYFDTTVPKGVWVQESIENFVGGGESNVYSSVLNDFPDSTNIPTTLQPKDKMISRAHEGPYARPAGNYSNGYYETAFRDIDPTTSIWNN
jgi:hypothetical protein